MVTLFHPSFPSFVLNTAATFPYFLLLISTVHPVLGWGSENGGGTRCIEICRSLLEEYLFAEIVNANAQYELLAPSSLLQYKTEALICYAVKTYSDAMFAACICIACYETAYQSSEKLLKFLLLCESHKYSKHCFT
jgi:hypothetical protein